MVKQSRAVAHRRVLALADQLQQRLLVHEQVCFADVDRAFRRHLPELKLKTVRGIRNSHDLRESWVDAHSAAIADCRPAIDKLARLAADRSLTSIRRELGEIEKALPGKHAGVTDRAIAACHPERIWPTQADFWWDRVKPYRAAYRSDQTYALARAKTLEELQVWLFSETSTPRGVWWAAASGIKEKARAACISTAGQVRTEAMGAFNDHG